MQYFNLGKSLDDACSGGGLSLLYQVDPKITKGSFPEITDKYDSNNGVSSDHTRLVCQIAHNEVVKGYGSSRIEESSIMPRILWVKK